MSGREVPPSWRMPRGVNPSLWEYAHTDWLADSEDAYFLNHPLFREDVKALSIEMEEPKWYAILEAVVEAMRPYARLGVNVNVDFYAGVIYYLLGIPEDLFVPIFAVGRIPGWTLQVLEQYEHNILIRPLLQYVGPGERAYVPIEERG